MGSGTALAAAECKTWALCSGPGAVQEPERAVAMYEEALQLGAPSSALFAKLARTYAAMHHYKRALAEYAKASRLQPSDPALRLEKVAMLLRMRDTDRASAELDACATLLDVCCPLPLSAPASAHVQSCIPPSITCKISALMCGYSISSSTQHG